MADLLVGDLLRGLLAGSHNPTPMTSATAKASHAAMWKLAMGDLPLTSIPKPPDNASVKQRSNNDSCALDKGHNETFPSN
ncbi:hypothetical protein [Mycobacterium leprae]|uniref:hypothetical protein n=1 Tax=Mycobacterium leprae TaxID=1769 RepID=UPI000A9BE942|nr:hypothetical protein [Mycobacterium leprae]